MAETVGMIHNRGTYHGQASACISRNAPLKSLIVAGTVVRNGKMYCYQSSSFTGAEQLRSLIPYDYYSLQQ